MKQTEQVRPFRFDGERLILLDQTKLPMKVEYVLLSTVEQIWQAIRTLQVRGAPAIGMVAAYGYCLGARAAVAEKCGDVPARMAEVRSYLESARPTAVHLFWAMERMERVFLHVFLQDESDFTERLLAEATAIQTEDERACRAMGEHLLPLLHDGMGVLTHCNTGALATSQYGTALAGFYLAKERGWDIHVYADETRPVLQGARLTTWELQQAGIDVTLICDSMAATVLAQGRVQAVMVGADRIAMNGDTANKIGTYGVAVLAKHFGVPFYVVAPVATIDVLTGTGAAIPIEERPAAEVVEGFGKRIAPEHIHVYNPAFDVTPHDLITAIITERGAIYPPYSERLTELF